MNTANYNLRKTDFPQLFALLPSITSKQLVKEIYTFSARFQNSSNDIVWIIFGTDWKASASVFFFKARDVQGRSRYSCCTLWYLEYASHFVWLYISSLCREVLAFKHTQKSMASAMFKNLLTRLSRNLMWNDKTLKNKHSCVWKMKLCYLTAAAHTNLTKNVCLIYAAEFRRFWTVIYSEK